MTLMHLAKTRHTTLASARIAQLKREIAAKTEELHELETLEHQIEEVEQ